MLFKSKSKLKVKLGKKKWTIKDLETIDRVRIRDTVRCLELVIIRTNGKMEICYSDPEWYGYGIPVKDYTIDPKDLESWYLEPSSRLKYFKYAKSGCFTSSNPYNVETYVRVPGKSQLFFEECTKSHLYYSEVTNKIYTGEDTIQKIIDLDGR